jgi:elongation factor G
MDMASRSSESIKNIMVSGHSTCGKTTLIESLLFTGGAISRKGRVEDGNTVCDYEERAKERKHSIDLSCASVERQGKLLQFIDTPGYRDFIGQVYCAATAVESMLLVVSADEGIRPNTLKVWQIAQAARLGCFIVVNRADREHAKFEEILAQLQDQLDKKCLAMTVPNAVGTGFSQVELTLGNPAPSSKAKGFADQLLEAVVESNDAMMERYLAGETISPVEVEAQLLEAVAARRVFPVFITSAEKGLGVEDLLNALAKFASPASRDLGRKAFAHDKREQVFDVKTTSDAPLFGRVFKIFSDPYVGKLSLVRLFSGSLAANGTFTNPHTGKTEKAGKIVRLQGKDQTTAESVSAGEMCALVKVEGLKSFDVLTGDRRLVMDPPAVPRPMASLAVGPKTKADEKKFAESLTKILDEDVTLLAEREKRTHELVVSGMSALHLQIVWEKLKARYGVEVTTKQPKTPYLETITAVGDDHYRHKKQTGGAGEFAEVWLKVEPLERGKGFEFVNDVFGGAIGNNYVQSAEKGVRMVMDQGVLAGCQVVDVKVSVYDGKEHPVDSKDIAFQKAGREAFKLAMAKAKPVLLEPIVNMEVTFPAETMGDIQGDLTRRRGRVQGMESLGSLQILKAQVPLAEIADYASTLGSITGGQGSYTIEMSHYEVVPPNIQQKVVEAAKAEMAKED